MFHEEDLMPCDALVAVVLDKSMLVITLLVHEIEGSSLTNLSSTLVGSENIYWKL